MERLEETIESGVVEQLMNVDDDEGGAGSVNLHHEAQPTPERFKQAVMSYKTAPLIRLSQSIDRLKEQHSVSFEGEEERQLQLALLYMLRTSFFDEGYYGQGTFAKTCSNIQGQMHERKIESFQETLRRSQLDQRPINELIREGEGFAFNTSEAAETTAQQHASAVVENLAFYRGHYSHKVEGNEGNLAKNQEALIATSKYSQRSLDSAHALLETVEVNQVPASSDPILEGTKMRLQRSRRAFEQSRNLEKVKRSRQLNHAAAEQLLLQQLPKEVDQAQFKEHFELIDARVEEMRYEESLTPDDLYLLMVSKLDELGYVELNATDYRGLPTSEESLVPFIVKARCGCRPEPKLDVEAAKREGGSNSRAHRSVGVIDARRTGFF